MAISRMGNYNFQPLSISCKKCNDIYDDAVLVDVDFAGHDMVHYDFIIARMLCSD